MRPILLAVLVLASCAIGPNIVDRSEAHRMVSRGAVLLDVRTPAEFAGGHLDGAVNIPLDQLGARAHELAAAPAVVVYCHSGIRAALAVGVLQRAGARAVGNLGPMSAW